MLLLALYRSLLDSGLLDCDPDPMRIPCIVLVAGHDSRESTRYLNCNSLTVTIRVCKQESFLCTTT